MNKQVVCIIIILGLLTGCHTNNFEENLNQTNINTINTAVTTGIETTSQSTISKSITTNNDSETVNNMQEKALFNELIPSKGDIFLGMNIEDAKNYLAMNAIPYETFFTSTDSSDLSIGYPGVFTDNFSFWADETDNTKICGIAIVNNISTSLGINIGDSIHDAFDAYGDEYTTYKTSNENTTYEYVIDTYYFQIRTTNNSITSFRICKDPFEN